jgi:guanine deaminase
MSDHSSLLIQHGLVLINAYEPPAVDTDILIQSGKIVAVGKNLDAAPETRRIDATGLLLAPGLINGHFHSHEHFHKGRFDNLPLELWMHFVRPPIAPPPLTPEQVYLRTMIGAIEALRTGTTFVVDDVNHAPHFSEDCIEAVFRAYQDIGLRALVSISLFDRPFYRSVPFVDDEMPLEVRSQLNAQSPPESQHLLDLVQKFAQSHHPDQHRVGFIVAPSAPQRCSDSFLIQVAQLANQYSLPMMMHVLETRLQAVTGRLFYNASMVEHLAQLNVLSSRLALQHCVWLTPRDIDLLAKSGTSVVYNPLSNCKLGSGQMPVQAFLEAGVNVALASDGCGSRDSLNMLSVVQATALLNKSPKRPPEEWISAETAFVFATEGGAKAFGRQGELGQLKPGFCADLVGYRLTKMPFVPLNNPLRQLVYAETGASVELVVVDGVDVMRDGQLTQVDEAALIQDIIATHQQLLPSLETSESTVQTLLPYYRRIYDRCQNEAIDPAILT